MNLYPLDTFPYEFPGKEIKINFEIPEFTCICPFSDFPDFATIRLEYVPHERCVEHELVVVAEHVPAAEVLEPRQDPERTRPERRDVSEADEVGALLGFGVSQNHLQRLQIGVNIGNNRVSHFALRQRTISKPRNSSVASFQAACSFRMNRPTSES